MNYSMTVTGSFKEPLDRQIMEKVQISNYKGDILMNWKTELGGAILEREQFKYRRLGAGGITGGQRAAGTRWTPLEYLRDKLGLYNQYWKGHCCAESTLPNKITFDIIHK